MISEFYRITFRLWYKNGNITVESTYRNVDVQIKSRFPDLMSILLSRVDSKRVAITVKLNSLCPYPELFWSAFSRIRNEYGEILRIFPYSVRMRENADQNNSEYGHFLRREKQRVYPKIRHDYKTIYIKD